MNEHRAAQPEIAPRGKTPAPVRFAGRKRPKSRASAGVWYCRAGSQAAAIAAGSAHTCALVNGEQRVYFVYFLRDANGVWRMDGM